MSGAGTNAGIEYQQRVASLLLTYQYGGMDISGLLGVPEPGHITEIRFETDSPIDDIAVQCREKWHVELQVKRRLTLSARPDSDFVKACAQFVEIFVKEPTGRGFFALVTTSDTSTKIRYDLRKLFESVRLNDSAFSKNPLNQSESETLALIRGVFDRAFLTAAGRAPTDADFVAFCKRAFIAIVDVEAGMPLENAALLMLKQRGFARPELAWSLLIKNCLHYAAERMSVNLTGLNSLLDAFKVDSDTASIGVSVSGSHFEVVGKRSMSLECGKRILPK